MDGPDLLISDDDREELARRGRSLYETRLKALLEPEQDRRFVAVHVDTGEYAVGRTSGEAVRDMHRRHPADGRLYVRRIGTEPEYALAARILASDMIAARQK